MDYNSEQSGAREDPEHHDMPTVSFENAAGAMLTGNQVMLLTQTLTETRTMSIVYGSVNDASQSSAFFPDYGAAEMNIIGSPSNDSTSPDHHFDWDSNMNNYVIQGYIDPTMQPMMESNLLDEKQEDHLSPSPPQQTQPQCAENMDLSSSTLTFEDIPMTWDNAGMDARQFDFMQPEMMMGSPDNGAPMAEPVSSFIPLSSFGSSGWNAIFTESSTSSQNVAYQQVPLQTSSNPDQQNEYFSNLPLFGCHFEPVMNPKENLAQREMNDADNGNHTFLAQEFNLVLESIKGETEDETDGIMESQDNPSLTRREMTEANMMARDYNHDDLESLKQEMESGSNITVEHQLNEMSMQGTSPPQLEINQVKNEDVPFPESEYSHTLESVKVELGNDTNITVEHQVNQLPMNYDFPGTPPVHQSQQTPATATLQSQELLGSNYATFNFGDGSDPTTDNLFIAPTPYSSQIQVNSPCGSYSDSGFSSSQFSSQDLFSSQEGENLFTTKELNEVYDEVDGFPPINEQPGESQDVTMLDIFYNPMSVPLPNDSSEYQDDNQNTSEEDEEPEAPKKRRRRSGKSSKRSRVSRASRGSGKRAGAVGTSNSECGSSDGDYSGGKPATQGSSTAGGAQRVHRVRVKDDVNSFRYRMGTHLRTLSAVLEMSGLKMVHELVPYEVIRRFHPTDVYRTISRSVMFMESVGTGDPATSEPETQPDWEQFVATSDGGEISMLEASNDRIYYKSPFGRVAEEGEDEAEVVIVAPKEPCTVSMRHEVEINGMLAQSPEVKTGVGSAELNVKLNLHKVAERCTNVEFKQSPIYDRPLIMRLKNPQSIAFVYDTGKMIVIGTKSYDDFRTAVRKFARMIQKTGVNVQLTQLKMHFYIGLFILPFDINVDAMRNHEYLSKFLMHDISIFPGVIIKLPNNPMLCLVFETGAVVFTNVVQIDDMKQTLDTIYPTLRLFGHQH